MSLNQIASTSMTAVNQWVGVINSNLKGASRTAYKTTRVNFSDGIGITSLGSDFQAPPTTLTVQSTKIEWGQGSITNTNNTTDFAIQGQGFFVLQDSAGRYYVSRDGEFHWDPDGYLVNSAGLRVLSSGQDFIRQHRTDINDYFDYDGQSRELEYYGDKSFLIADFANLDGLKMSRFGSTIFEVPGDLPFRVQNDFDNTLDGLTLDYSDPVNQPIVDDPSFVPNTGPGTSNVFIDFGDNGVLNLNFDPAVDTIATVVAAINAFAGANVTANFNTATDRLTIQNTVAPGGPIGNRIVFQGPNGVALRKFFKLGQNLPSDPALLTRTMSSQEDIDNNTDPLSLFPTDITAAQLGLTFNALVLPSLPTYSHNKLNDTLTLNGLNSPAVVAGARAIIGESQTTNQFRIETDFRVSDDLLGAGLEGFIKVGFGQKEAHNSNSGGYELWYSPLINLVILVQKGYSSADVPQVINIAPVLPVTLLPLPPTFPDITVPFPPGNDPLHNMVVELDEDGNLQFGIDGNFVNMNIYSPGIALPAPLAALLPPIVGGLPLINGGSEDPRGYLSIGNSLNRLELHGLEADFRHLSYNTNTAGEIVSIGPTENANRDIINPWQERTRARIIQSAKEDSLASVTEYVPMLAVAQKVFASISKIITTFNATVDDLNSLIR